MELPYNCCLQVRDLDVELAETGEKILDKVTFDLQKGEIFALVGESGSGKQVMARYLHTNSPRREGPFVDVAVGGMTTEGAAVELFGSEDHENIHYGRLEQANSGTLFLNDIAD